MTYSPLNERADFRLKPYDASRWLVRPQLLKFPIALINPMTGASDAIDSIFAGSLRIVAHSFYVDVRVIAATNTVLAKAVAEGRFRDDLYYRLNGFPLTLPPLRERKEDLPLLARHFLHRYAQALGKPIRTMDPETVGLLVDYHWPGNVRELENAIEHAVIVEEGATICPASLPMNLDTAREARQEQGHAEPKLRDKLNIFERQILIEALARANGIRKRAAAMLGVDARNLPYLLRKHRLFIDLAEPGSTDEVH